jgi:hypothetical protein
MDEIHKPVLRAVPKDSFDMEWIEKINKRVEHITLTTAQILIVVFIFKIFNLIQNTSLVFSLVIL